MNNLKYFFGKNTNEELKKLSLLLTKVFKKKFDLNYLIWLYRDNPNGEAITFNISKNKKIVGHYAVIPSEIVIGNKIYKAALSLNTAVDDNFRGKGFFKIMASKTFEKCLKKKIRFIFGVSNNQSTTLFEKYFNFKNYGELNVIYGFGKVNQKKNNEKFQINWNKKSLDWRLRNPNKNYDVYYNEKDNIEINYKMLNCINIHMGNFDTKFFKNRKLNKINFSLLNVKIGLGKNYLNNLFYFNLPKNLKPSPLNFILKDLSLKKNNLKIKRQHIYFQLIDFDAF